MKTGEALLFARTVRHRRPIQVLGQARRALSTGTIDQRPAPPVRKCKSLTDPALCPPVLVGPTTVEMLGERGHLQSESACADPGQSALWRYHCHYFDDLCSEGRDDRAPRRGDP